MSLGRFVYLLAAISFLFGASACADKPLHFGENEAGILQYLRDGQKAILTLEMPGGTGYIWKVKIEDETIVKIVKKDIQIENIDMTGGSMKRIYVFKARKKGTTTIEAILVRPWELDKPVKTLSFTIKVL